MEQTKRINLPPGEDEFYGLSEDLFRQLTPEQLQGFRDIHTLALFELVKYTQHEAILETVVGIAEATKKRY
jgi:hypothetical protein